MIRPTCGTCDWFSAGRGGRGACGYAPPVAAVVGHLDHMGGQAVDGALVAQTLRPEVAVDSPCCSRHPAAADWQRRSRA